MSFNDEEITAEIMGSELWEKFNTEFPDLKNKLESVYVAMSYRNRAIEKRKIELVKKNELLGQAIQDLAASENLTEKEKDAKERKINSFIMHNEKYANHTQTITQQRDVLKKIVDLANLAFGTSVHEKKEKTIEPSKPIEGKVSHSFIFYRKVDKEWITIKANARYH
jgi:hypothetical protein